MQNEINCSWLTIDRRCPELQEVATARFDRTWTTSLGYVRSEHVRATSKRGRNGLVDLAVGSLPNAYLGPQESLEKTPRKSQIRWQTLYVAEVRKSYWTWKMLQDERLLAKFGFDTAENGLSKIWQIFENWKFQGNLGPKIHFRSEKLSLVPMRCTFSASYDL